MGRDVTDPKASSHPGFADASALKHRRFNRKRVSLYMKRSTENFPKAGELDQTSGHNCTKGIPPSPRSELVQPVCLAELC